jgi:hypothetical protein
MNETRCRIVALRTCVECLEHELCRVYVFDCRSTPLLSSLSILTLSAVARAPARYCSDLAGPSFACSSCSSGVGRASRSVGRRASRRSLRRRVWRASPLLARRALLRSVVGPPPAARISPGRVRATPRGEPTSKTRPEETSTHAAASVGAILHTALRDVRAHVIGMPRSCAAASAPRQWRCASSRYRPRCLPSLAALSPRVLPPADVSPLSLCS